MILQIKNVLHSREIKKLYNDLLATPEWSIISAYGDDFNPTPVLNVTYDNNPLSMKWHGFFQGLYLGLNTIMLQQHNFNLGDYSLNTVTLNAQKNFNDFVFHSHDDYRYSIVGFLTPQWQKEWGGELQIEEKTINFKPGDFILFDGKKLHDALPVKMPIPFWRVTIAMFIK